jgi:hypothetical protein
VLLLGLRVRPGGVSSLGGATGFNVLRKLRAKEILFFCRVACAFLRKTSTHFSFFIAFGKTLLFIFNSLFPLDKLLAITYNIAIFQSMIWWLLCLLLFLFSLWLVGVLSVPDLPPLFLPCVLLLWLLARLCLWGALMVAILSCCLLRFLGRFPFLLFVVLLRSLRPGVGCWVRRRGLLSPRLPRRVVRLRGLLIRVCSLFLSLRVLLLVLLSWFLLPRRVVLFSSLPRRPLVLFWLRLLRFLVVCLFSLSRVGFLSLIVCPLSVLGLGRLPRRLFPSPPASRLLSCGFRLPVPFSSLFLSRCVVFRSAGSLIMPRVP